LVRTNEKQFVIEGAVEDDGGLTHRVVRVLESPRGPAVGHMTGGGEVGKSRMTLLLEDPGIGAAARLDPKRLPARGGGFRCAGRWRGQHRPSGWSDYRLVHADGTFVDYDGKPGTWHRDGGLLHLHFADGGREWVAIDADNPDELNGRGGAAPQAATWV